MVLLSVEQAAKRLKKTDRTIRRWIQEGKLAASHPTHVRTDKYLIEASAVEQLATALAKEQPEQEHEDQDQDTSSLESRVEQLEQRLEKLEQVILRLGTPEPTIVGRNSLRPYTASRPSRKRATIATETPGTPDDIPVDALFSKDFAELHGVNERTFRDHIDKGHVPAIKRPKVNRPHESERWLTPEDQQRAIAYWQEIGTAYSTCDNPVCPCHQDQDTGSQLELEQEIEDQE